MGCIPVIAEADVTGAGGRYYPRTGSRVAARFDMNREEASYSRGTAPTL